MGLRFDNSEAKQLQSIADQLRQERRPDIDISLFDKAAQSATQSEPLIVLCSHPQEAERMAQGFTRWGLQRPAIDPLNG